jgi:hypothetical protein
MDIAHSTAAERIARTLAAHALSANGQGLEESASQHVGDTWREHLPAALLVLKTLREPSRAMADAGDPAVWERMILTAIGEAQPAGQVM